MILPHPKLEGLHTTMDLGSGVPTVRSVGQIRKVVGLTLESLGPLASLGDLVSIEREGVSGSHRAEVVGFTEGKVLLMPIDGVEGIRPGDRVVRVNEGFRIPVGEGLQGRVLDPLCRPVDDLGPVPAGILWDVWRAPPNSMSRPRVDTSFGTGVRAVDAVLSCGRGQRVGIFAGSGVGKSTLLGMICRHSAADVNVVAMIGERGKEVRDFVEDSLGAEGLRKSVVLVATSDRPALQRVKGAEVAMAIAEYFRDQGLHVFLVMDSLTRYAMAQREIGLATGEPPASRGYPPSVFGALPRLLERAGNSERGSITGFFNVLVEGDDLNDPVADTVRGIVDGHIVLSRDLAVRGHYPAIDVLASVSRVADYVTTPEHGKLAQELRLLLSIYHRAEDMISIGAYKAGTQPDIDRAIAAKPLVDRFLQQGREDYTDWDKGLDQLRELIR